MGLKQGFAVGGLLLAMLIMVAFSPSAFAKPADKPGVERWSVKISVPPGSLDVQVMDVAIEKMVAMPAAPGVTHNDARYQDARLPFGVEGMREGQIVRVRGWLWLVGGEREGDYHMQVSASPTSGAPCLVVEVPSDTIPGVAPELAERYAKVRQVARSLVGRSPAMAGSTVKRPMLVDVTGQLFYDDAHVGMPPRGKKGMKSGTLWEIHPVTALEVVKT